MRAALWKRQPVEDGGLFVKYFAVLEKGRLDFYNKEKVRDCRLDEWNNWLASWLAGGYPVAALFIDQFF